MAIVGSGVSDSAKYEIVVIGSGPAGLSAAARAAELGASHILLEASDQLALTIQRYQKGKHVMAEPGFLPLRSGIEFDAGTRENILSNWEQGAAKHKVNVAFRAEVIAITGEKGAFEIETRRGQRYHAKSIVLAIGLQGNPRLLGAPGQEADFVQYQLDDPDEYRDETIVVVGAGDAAIENALALATHNRVYIVNRRDEFARAKEGNLNKITDAINRGKVQGLFNTTVKEVIHKAEDNKPGVLLLNTADGEVRIPVNRVIARLGAIPPRDFVEKCGVQFPSDAPAAVPELSAQYESNVTGLYIIGALGGYPLIKQAMNQGYEAVEYIRGNPIKPVDHDLLAKKFAGLPFDYDVEEMLAFLRNEILLFKPVNPLRFRELILESNVFCPPPGDVIFARNDYTDSFYYVVDGWVEIVVDEEKDTRIRVTAGQFFGEMSLISGRRRSATVYAGEFCVLIETPRRSMMRLINSIDEVKRRIDEVFMLRAIHSQFAPNSDLSDLGELISSAELRNYNRGEVLFAEGEEGDELHLVRRGSLTVSRYINGRDVVLSYVPAGKYVGEMGLLGNIRRTASVRAAVPTETVVMKSGPFLQLLGRDPELKTQVEEQIRQRLSLNSRIEAGGEGGELLSFLMAQGLGEATDVLLIDESLCIRCDNCEKACADTHEGTSRLDREAGPTYAQIHVPTSCRHCEHPHCMKDCPPDAISRNASGEVTIADNCIGCGNCESNCPYGVIQMAYPGNKQPSVWSRILFGSEAKTTKSADAQKRAVKCDMCTSLKGGPACVRACPTGAAIRTSPENFVDLIKRGG
ncbi:MAG: cyclic nucleotide-binding domain-containing protein [Alcanivoracaceae bacterium]|nr:cyclic nucleotide-binding domain-containing protein [Alcanivoracaceae bacterium]